ncbi:hypothetical protein [Arthrobacter globiformis]|nr:hypothetical protein [Arthrobacter globiformis]
MIAGGSGGRTRRSLHLPGHAPAEALGQALVVHWTGAGDIDVMNEEHA